MTGAFVDKFSDAPDHYRRTRPTYPRTLFAALAELAPSRERAWDCGTGNGQAAAGLAEFFAAVHASDPSPQQIAAAPPAERVTYHVELAERTALADGSVDLVLAAQSLHWFDRPFFYAEAVRVLRPSGILAAIGYDWMYVDDAVDAVLGRDLLGLLAPHWAPNNRLLWDGYRSIDFPGEDIRLGPHAIYRDWRFEDVRGYILSWSAARALVAGEGPERFDAALAALGAAWGEGSRRVVMPLYTRVARIG